MNIVHLIFSFQIGGAEAMLADIVNEQCKTEKVTLVIINNLVTESMLERVDPKVPVVRIDRTPSGRSPLPLVRLNCILHKINPDVIHCHDVKGIGLLSPSHRKRTVLTIHDTQIVSPYFNRYKKRFAISESVKDDIFRRYNLNSDIVRNGIRIGEIIPRGKSERNPELFRMVQIGRLEHQKKGQDLLIEAISRLVHEFNRSNIHLDIIGSGFSLAFLKEMACKYALNDYISFCGERDRASIYQRLHDYDLLVQPSIYEGFGLTVAEAMAAGVPVLVSDIEGPMELIKGGEYGYCFNTGDPVDLTQKIDNIISDYDGATKLAERARAYVAENFSIEQTARNYILRYSAPTHH